MNREEHFKEAERLAQISVDTLPDYTRNRGPAAAAAMAMMMWATAQAQVHATLAMAEAQSETTEMIGSRFSTHEGDLSVRVYGSVSTR